jgi:hypothetical protein
MHHIARKRLKNTGFLGVINPLKRKNRSGRTYQAGLKPVQPETLSRQVLRRMLREKAHDDIVQQYGIMGRDKGRAPWKHAPFVGFDPSFPRRVRRSVMKAIVKRWYAQVLANTTNNKRPSEGVLGWFRSKLNIGARANTLKASGVGI